MYTYGPHIYIAMGILLTTTVVLLYEIWLMTLRPPIDIHAVAFQQLLDLFDKMTAEPADRHYTIEDMMAHAQSTLYALRRSRVKIQTDRKLEFYRALIRLLMQIEHRHGTGRYQSRKCLQMISSVRHLTTPSAFTRSPGRGVQRVE